MCLKMVLRESLNKFTVSRILTKYRGGTKMATFTVSIPKELKEKMDKHPHINWPEYIKERFEIKLKQLRKFEELVNRGEI